MTAAQCIVPPLDPTALKRAMSEARLHHADEDGSHSTRMVKYTSRKPSKPGGVGIRYGEFWIQGKRKSMEDAHTSALDAAHHLPDNTPSWGKSDPDNHFALFGIFDGHGGARAAEFAASHLLPFMQHEKLSQVDTKTALERALAKVEQEYLKLAAQLDEHDGTCAAVMVIDGNTLIAAGIGDSEMVLSRNGQAVPLCDVHTPSRNLAEAARVQQTGCLDRTRMRVNDRNGVMSLEPSRTIGDYQFKIQNTGVLSTPDIQVFHLRPPDEFVIMACDGVWDVVGHQESVDFCRGLLQQGASPSVVARRLVDHAYAKGSTDNISACIVQFEYNNDEMLPVA